MNSPGEGRVLGGPSIFFPVISEGSKPIAAPDKEGAITSIISSSSGHLRVFYAAWGVQCLVRRTEKLCTPLLLISAGSTTGLSVLYVTSHSLILAVGEILLLPILSPYMSTWPRGKFLMYIIFTEILFIFLTLVASLPLMTFHMEKMSYIAGLIMTVVCLTSMMVGTVISQVMYLLQWICIRRDWPAQLSLSKPLLRRFEKKKMASRDDMSINNSQFWSNYVVTSINSSLESIELGMELFVAVLVTVLLWRFEGMPRMWKVIMVYVTGFFFMGLLYISRELYGIVAKSYEFELQLIGDEEVDIEPKLSDTQNHVQFCESPRGRMATILSVQNWFKSVLPASLAGCQSLQSLYVSIVVCSSSIGLVVCVAILLHFGPLNPGNGLLDAWLATTAYMPLHYITGVKLLSSVMCLMATQLVPFLYALHPSSSLISMNCFLFSCVFGCVSASFILIYKGDDFNIAASGILSVCLILCRVFKTMGMVTLNTILQLGIPSRDRGSVNGVVLASVSGVRLVYYGLSTVLSYGQLSLVAVGSMFVEAMALVAYVACQPIKPHKREEYKKRIATPLLMASFSEKENERYTNEYKIKHPYNKLDYKSPSTSTTPQKTVCSPDVF